MKEYTKNGIELKWSLSSPEGANFVLFPEPGHTKEQIKEAKAEIRRERDVTGLRIANEYDRFGYFKSEVFKDSRTKPLHWSQIQCEMEDWKNEGKPDPAEYVSKHIEEWKNNEIIEP